MGMVNILVLQQILLQHIGGSMTNSIIGSWSDKGIDTVILDQWTKKLPYIQVGTTSSGSGRANLCQTVPTAWHVRPAWK